MTSHRVCWTDHKCHHYKTCAELVVSEIWPSRKHRLHDCCAAVCPFAHIFLSSKDSLHNKWPFGFCYLQNVERKQNWYKITSTLSSTRVARCQCSILQSIIKAAVTCVSVVCGQVVKHCIRLYNLAKSCKANVNNMLYKQLYIIPFITAGRMLPLLCFSKGLLM